MSRRGSRTSRRSTLFDPDGARAVAEGIDRALAEGRADGRARRRAGHHQGQYRHQRRSRCRSAPPAVKLVPAATDAPPAARLREAGAIIFAKTTMPDYGMLSSGLSSFHPLTRNPWDLSKNPGGSSSGAGAAAAAGYGPLHLGTDIGGSVRLPACWCGLVALKPSFGRDSGRSALCRPRRRADDPHRRRRGADDERAVAAGPPRRHEPAAHRHPLEGARQVAAQAAHRPDARCSVSARRWRRKCATSPSRRPRRSNPPAPSSPKSTAS